jgi:sigma-B regulation protein RsbU (phosphoserine phosphatase)
MTVTETLPFKILVVDDEPLLESLINQKFKNKIKEKKFEFTFARNGVQALEILNERTDICLILLDLNMPVMNGFTFLDHLNQENRLERVIVVTAYGDMINLRKAMNGGASDFITKPIDLSDLEHTIERNIIRFQGVKEADAAHKELVNLSKELDVAKGIQKSLIPSNFNKYGPLDSVLAYGEVLPVEEMGGDFFDIFTLDSDHIGFFIGEVAGRGIPAAIFMTITRTLLHTFALKLKSPASCFEKINKLLLAKPIDFAIFLSAFYGILNTKTGIVQYCNAGHRPLFILPKDKKIREIGRYEGIPLAVTEDPASLKVKFEDKEFQLKSGETMALYTSGTVQIQNSASEMYSEDRLKASLLENSSLAPKELVFAIKNDLLNFSNGAPQINDVTLFCLRYQDKK